MIRKSTHSVLRKGIHSYRNRLSIYSTRSAIRSASTLIIAEPTSSDSTSLAPATLSTITAANKLHSGPITILNFNPSLDTTISNIPSCVSNILTTTSKSPSSMTLAESLSSLIVKVQNDKSFTHIVAPATKFGSNVIPRAAAMLDACPVLDVIDVMDEQTFIRPMYAGNALAKVQSNESVKVLSIRSTAFDKADVSSATENNDDDVVISVENIDCEEQSLTEYISSNESTSDRPDLSSASVVVSGGRGMKDGTNFEMLYALADKLNGAVGASRAAVDAGYVPNDMQVGQTGKVVAPDLYIAVGISGAIQHLSGMKDSKTIVAINNDPEAPIFQVADYGLVCDLFKAVPELTEKL